MKSALKKKPFIKRHKVASIIIIVVAIILVIAIAVIIYAYSKASLLKRNNNTVAQSQTSSQTSSVDDSDENMDDEMKGLSEAKIKEAEGKIFSDKNVFNIMLIGTDERSKEFSTFARGDTCMILSLNKKTGESKLVSFERGQGVKILDGEYKGQYDWLTHTFAYGGADLMMKEIRENYKIDVTHYVRTNISTFSQLVESVGGVDINLSKEEADYINTAGKFYANEIHEKDKVQTVTVGNNHLNGTTAMVYARCRHIDSDWQRVERQRNVIKESLVNVKKLNLVELNSLMDNVFPLIQTNLSDGDLLNLITLMPKYNNLCDDTMTYPVKGTYGSMKGMGGRSMFATDFQKNSELIKEFLYGDNN